MEKTNFEKKPNENPTFYTLDGESLKQIYIYEPGVSAGFPSPAEDYLDTDLNLHKYLVKHPTATFFVRARGHSMKNAGISDGDLLVIDKSLEAKHKDIIIASLNGEFTVKRYMVKEKKIFLQAENSSHHYPNIEITEEMDFEVWGVLTYTIHKNH